MAIWAALVLAAVLLVAVSVYGVTRPAPPSGPPQPGVIVSYRYLPISRLCGAGRLDADVQLNNGEIVRAGSYQHGPVHRGMRVTVERRRSVCLDTPYTISREDPPNSPVRDSSPTPGA